MTRFVAPENDTRGLPEPSVIPQLRVSVVIPVYNRVGLLERVVAGLAVQDHPAELTEVVVADDGSTEDVAAALAPWQDRLDLTVVRREHEGYGAGQARNLGARTATGDVVLFVDADCLPARSLVRRHAAWHELADNLVVVGARHDLDTSEVTATAIAEGDHVVDAGDGSRPSDWRDLFYRRTAQLEVGDEAYRAVVSNNLSVTRSQFLAVGGFSEDFVRWGGEDTELGWRLQRAGCFIVADDHAVVHHQVQEDGEEGWRDEHRALNDGIVRSKIPHRFHRRPDPLVLHEVPKVSWVVLPPRAAAAEQLWAELDNHTHRDWELVLHDPDGELATFADLHAADPRVQVVTDPDPLAALGATRGELLLLVHGGASPDRHAASRIVRRMDQRPRTQVVTVGVAEQTDGAPRLWTNPADVVDLPGQRDVPWPPLVAVRGREVAKVLPLADDLDDLWQRLGELCSAEHLRQPLVAVAGDGGAARPVALRLPSRRRLVADAVAGDADPAAVARALAVSVRDRLRPGDDEGATRVTGQDAPVAATPAVDDTGDATSGDAAPADDGEAVEELVPVRYVGWTGRDNIGDEAMLAAARQLLPWADVTTKGEPGRLLVLGGGTLVNRGYLKVLREWDSPRSERIVLGTGVASQDFWGWREDPADWAQWLGTCGYVGVRGPDSLERLDVLGFDGEAEVCGDLALALEAPQEVERTDGLLVVSPVHTGGKLHGGDDLAVLDVLGDLLADAVSDGRPVHLLSCHPADDRWCIELLRRCGAPDLPHTAGYDDLDTTMRLLASADVVVAERLHAGVLAAVAGTPFVPIEYRPKTRDFARSVGADDVLLRTDELTLGALRDALSKVEATRDERVERVTTRVAAHRASLQAAARQIRGLVL